GTCRWSKQDGRSRVSLLGRSNYALPVFAILSESDGIDGGEAILEGTDSAYSASDDAFICDVHRQRNFGFWYSFPQSQYPAALRSHQDGSSYHRCKFRDGDGAA